LVAFKVNCHGTPDNGLYKIHVYIEKEEEALDL
jgi:hypothetical protein